MESNTGLVAGSHNRQQLFVIRQDVDQVHRGSSPHTCQICGDAVGTDHEGNLFVACNDCGFPACRTCYEYEREFGTGNCYQCKLKYKRHKGSPRVPGDPEEDDVVDFEDEFRFANISQPTTPAPLTIGGPQDQNGFPQNGYPHQYPGGPGQYPLLTNGPMSDTESLLDANEHNRVVTVPGGQSPAGTARDQHHQQQQAQHGAYLNGDANHQVPKYQGPPLGVDGREQAESLGHGSIVWSRPEFKGKQLDADMEMVAMQQNGALAAADAPPPTPPPRGPGSPESDSYMMDEARQPLSRKVNLPSAQINPYRLIILARLVILGFFLRYRVLNPVPGAYGLWLTSVICEIWFAVSWIFDQFPKWMPINRETYINRLSMRFERDGHSALSNVDLFVSTVDPAKEPPLATANTILSILAMDYPAEKVSCYLSDDGAAYLTFNALIETAEFARRWVPFAKKYSIEPRAPESYFKENMDYLKDVVDVSFVRDRRAMKREYESYRVRMNALCKRYEKMPEEGWIMPDGTSWPGNNSRDHPGMIQVFLGPSGGYDVEGNPLPRLVYVSREKRPGYNHHKKAGAMNALVRVSAVLTNAPFILNLDCDHYVNNSKALREAMCFMMDSDVGKKTCYVQFPQRFDGIDTNDRYANHNTVFFDINMRGLDGLQGPVYVGTGTCFRRQALYGYAAPTKKDKKASSLCCFPCCGGRNKEDKEHKKSKVTNTPDFNVDDLEAGGEGEEGSLLALKEFEKKFGPSPVFILSTFHEENGGTTHTNPESVLKEAIHVISCGYEIKSDWGKELGWIYGSVTEDILTGFRMHCRGWRSIYCMPKIPAFKGSAPINLSDRLQQVLRWALGSVEIFLSRNCPIWYGCRGRLKVLQRIAYMNTVLYPFTSFPLVAYCVLPAICLITDKFIIPQINSTAAMWFIALFLSVFATAALEMRWSGVGLTEWWRNEQFWVIGGVSSHLFAVFQGLLKVLAGIDTNFTVTSKQADDEGAFADLYVFKWTSLLVVPTTLVVINLIGIVAGLANAVNKGFNAWGPLFGKLFFSFWVVIHLYPFLKGLMGKSNRTPTIIIVWSILLASIFSLIWVKIDPFVSSGNGPKLTQCGVDC